MKMNTNDIATVYVAFTAAEGGKRRPVYILKMDWTQFRFCQLLQNIILNPIK